MTTKANLKALQWIADREPVSSFTVDGPSLSRVHMLEATGLVTQAGKDPGVFGFVRYKLTEAGRAALDAQP